MNIWEQYIALVVDFHHVSVKSYWEKLELVSLIEQQTAIYLSTKIYRKIENSSIRKRRIHTLKIISSQFLFDDNETLHKFMHIEEYSVKVIKLLHSWRYVLL